MRGAVGRVCGAIWLGRWPPRAAKALAGISKDAASAATTQNLVVIGGPPVAPSHRHCRVACTAVGHNEMHQFAVRRAEALAIRTMPREVSSPNAISRDRPLTALPLLNVRPTRRIQIFAPDGNGRVLVSVHHWAARAPRAPSRDDGTPPQSSLPLHEGLLRQRSHRQSRHFGARGSARLLLHAQGQFSHAAETELSDF